LATISTDRAGLWQVGLVYAPGESPFKVRGSTYVGIRDHVNERIPGGMETVAKALPEGPHRAFVTQIFAPASWYDALPIRPVTEVIAKLEGRDWAESVRSRAEELARRDLTVFRRFMFKASSPEKVVDKLQRAALQYFDFGEAEILEVTAGSSKVAYHGVPQPLGSWFLPMLEGYAGVLISTAGGKQVEVKGRLIPKGNKDGMQLVDVRVGMSWLS
jgi:hypothetical protein